MVIDSKVYNVTPFLQEHPGGDDILLDSSGRDATREFEDVGHSTDARSELAKLFIGDLRPPTEEELAVAEEQARLNSHLSTNKPGWISSVARWLLPILLVGFAVVLRKYVK